MEPFMKTLPPFAWIEQTDDNQVTNDLNTVLSSRGWPMLNIKTLPTDAVLQGWISKGMWFNLKRNQLSPTDAQKLFALAGNKVFFRGYVRSTMEDKLSKGASITISQDGDLGPDELLGLSQAPKPAGSKIWISVDELDSDEIKNLLNGPIKIVCSRYNLTNPLDMNKLLGFLAIGGEKVIINASSFSENQLQTLLNANASILFMGDASLSANQIQAFITNANPAQKNRIRVLLRNGTTEKLNAIKSTLQGTAVFVDEGFLFY